MFTKIARLFAKRGTSFAPPSDRSRLRTLLGVTALEDRTVPAAIPLTGPNGGNWVLIDTISVATRTNQTANTGVQSNVVLGAGTTYLAVASGTARIANDATGFADAEFIRYNKSTGPQDGSSPGYAWNNHGLRLDGVVGGSTTGNFWGTYQSDHQYVREVTGQGTLLRGWYSDIPGYYGDNSGTLTVDIYAEVPEGTGIIGGIVWQDEVTDTTLPGNYDGIRQDYEPVVNGAVVELLDASGSVVATATSDSAGAYRFSGLPFGEYVVRFALPESMSFTLREQGNLETRDSDADPLTGFSGPVTLTPQQPNNLLIGAGLVANDDSKLDPLVVTTNLDVVDKKDGRISLREAVGTANKAPVGQLQRITFDMTKVGDLPITLDPTRQQMDLERNISIDGPADNIIIQRDSDSEIQHRIFRVQPGATVTLSHLYMYFGMGNEAGGGILSRGNLTLNNCRVSECGGEMTARGGGIAALAGSLTLTSTRIDRNNAAGQGGGIFIGERVTTDISGQGNFSDMEILANHARVGGGIYIDASTSQVPTSVVLSNVAILDNQADEKGAGIMVPGLGNSGASLTLLFTSVARNTVLSQNPTTGKGGGLYFGRGTLTLGGATFDNPNGAPTGPEAYRVIPGTTLVFAPLLPNDYEEVTGN